MTKNQGTEQYALFRKHHTSHGIFQEICQLFFYSYLSIATSKLILSFTVQLPFNMLTTFAILGVSIVS